MQYVYWLIQIFCIPLYILTLCLVKLYLTEISLRSLYYSMIVIQILKRSITTNTKHLLPDAANCGRFCFWRRQSVDFCVHEISRNRSNRWTDLRQIHTKDVLLPRSDEFEGQRQRSKVKVTRHKNAIFRPFRLPACGLFGKTSLACSLYFCLFSLHWQQYFLLSIRMRVYTLLFQKGLTNVSRSPDYHPQ